MAFLVGVLILLIIVLLSRYYFLLKGIKAVWQQLELIHEADETNQLVTNAHHFIELN